MAGEESRGRVVALLILVRISLSSFGNLRLASCSFVTKRLSFFFAHSEHFSFKLFQRCRGWNLKFFLDAPCPVQFSLQKLSFCNNCVMATVSVVNKDLTFKAMAKDLTSEQVEGPL